MPQVRGGRLERDRVAEPVGGRDRLLGGRPRAGRPTGRCRSSAAACCSSCGSRLDVVAVAGADRATRARAARTSSPEGDTVWPAGVARQAAYVGDSGQGADGVLGGGVRRHRAAAVAVGRPQRLGHAGHAEERRHDGLAGLAATPSRARRRPRCPRRAQRRDEQRDDRVDAVVGEDLVEGDREVLRRWRPAPSARVLADLRARPPRRRRRRAPPGRRSCRRRRPVGPPGSGWVGDQRGDVEHLVDRLGADHTGPPEQRVDRGRGRPGLAHQVAARARRRGTGRTSPRPPASGGPAGGRSG